MTESGTRRLVFALVKQRQLCVSFVALCYKTGAFKHAKFVIFKSVFVPILTCGHKSWVMTERDLSQVQAAEIEMQRVHGVTPEDNVHSCEIRKALNVEIRLLRI